MYKDHSGNPWYTFFSWQCGFFIPSDAEAGAGMVCIVIIPILVILYSVIIGGLIGLIVHGNRIRSIP